MSSKDSDETHTMHTKSNNMEIMIGSETDYWRTFWISFAKISRRIRKKMRGLSFDSVDLLDYKLHKIVQIEVDHIQILLSG